MNILFILLFFLSLICTPVFLILFLIQRFRKVPSGKYSKAAIASAVVVVVSFIGIEPTTEPDPLIESIELSISDYQAEYDVDTEIPVNISVLPDGADTGSLEYIVSDDSLAFSESGIITGSAEGTYEIRVKSGDVESNTLSISVVDIKAREAAREAEEKRLAEERAAKEAEEKRLAEEKAAQEAEEKRLAEERAAKEAEEKRLAEERAAKEAEEKRLAEEKDAQAGNASSGTSSQPPASSSTMVWVDDTAKRYHRKNGCGMDNAYQVTLDEAVAMGKTPCGRCY